MTKPQMLMFSLSIKISHKIFGGKNSFQIRNNFIFRKNINNSQTKSYSHLRNIWHFQPIGHSSNDYCYEKKE